MADWCALPRSAVALIARRLQLIEDFMAFRSTCSSWREATSATLKDKSCSRLPLLMLEDYDRYNYKIDSDESDESDESDKNYEIDEDEIEDETDEDETDEDEIEDETDEEEIEDEIDDEMDEIDEIDENDDNSEMDEKEEIDEIDEKDDNSEMDEKDDIDKMDDMIQMKDKLYEIFQRKEVAYKRNFLSLSKGKKKILLPEAKGMECIGSKGWLIMVKRSAGSMCLFHPISRLHIPLPKVPIQGFIEHKNFISAVLSARPSETSDYVVMVVFMEERYTSPGCDVLMTHTWFWKPGNLTWTEVDIPYWVEDLNYYNGKFYALTKRADVWMCDVSGPNPTASQIVQLPWKNRSRPHAQLVECGGRLLIVAPYFCHHYDLEFLEDLEMVEIDVINGSYNIITSLGSSTVFLGRNEGFSIDANRFPGIIQPNSIYFGDGSYQVATPGPNHESEPNFGSGVWLNF